MSLLKKARVTIDARMASIFPPASAEMPHGKFEFNVRPEDLMEERIPQFTNLGLPAEQLQKLKSDIKEMWAEGPGGWVHEWTKIAEGYAENGDHYKASLAYGGAKFPTIANKAKLDSLAKQVEHYVLASPGFPVKFDRQLVPCYHRDKAVPVPVHILSHPEAGANSPVLIGSGGVDTWKMDIHDMLVRFAMDAKCHVVGFDLPGNGELSDVPMDDTGDQIIRGLIQFARDLGNGTVAHFGFSMGGHYSALSGLRHDVDFAISCGGPVEDSFTERNARRLTAGYGMDGIMFNAIGRWTKQPPIETLIEAVPCFNLKYLLAANCHCPMLVINGQDDVHCSIADTTVFKGRKDTEVHLMSNTGHCCSSRLPEALDIMAKWLKQKFGA